MGAPLSLVHSTSSTAVPAPAEKRFYGAAERRPVVMVTGGGGFIGCHTVAALLAGGLHDVLVIDNLSSHGYPSSVKAANLQWLQERASECPGHLQIEHKDITDRMAMKSVFANGIDVVCHLAAHAGARESIASPESCININVGGTAILLELAALSGCKNFIFASSGSVYGAQASTGGAKQDMAVMREECVLGKPLSPYAVSKAAAEAMAAVYHHLYKLPTTGLRFFTIYGPRGRPEMAPLKFMSLIYKGLPIEQYGDGSSWRDYTFVDDAVDGILAAIDKPHDCEVDHLYYSLFSIMCHVVVFSDATLVAQIFNIGAGEPICLSEFINTLQKVMGCTATIVQKEEPKGDIIGTFADIQKSRKMLGYSPKVGLEEGLGKLFAWYKENLDTKETYLSRA